MRALRPRWLISLVAAIRVWHDLRTSDAALHRLNKTLLELGGKSLQRGDIGNLVAERDLQEVKRMEVIRRKLKVLNDGDEICQSQSTRYLFLNSSNSTHNRAEP